MRWSDFLLKFELTLITSLSDYFKGQFNCGVSDFPKVLEGLHKLTIFKLNSGMCDFLLLRALERMVNLESEMDLSDKTRHNLFTFLRTNKPYQFDGIFSNSSKFGEVLKCFEDEPNSVLYALILLREMTVV